MAGRLADHFSQSSEGDREGQPSATPRGKIFPIPGDDRHETAREFAAGMGACAGELLLAYGPDGGLYYATLAGDGQARKIVSS